MRPQQTNTPDTTQNDDRSTGVKGNTADAPLTTSPEVQTHNLPKDPEAAHGDPGDGAD